MIAPFPLYVDEISPDQTKATVSNGGTLFLNYRTMALAMPIEHWRGINKLNGLSIIPIGRFICIVGRQNGTGSMILLDLIGKEHLVEKMADTFPNLDLQNQFLRTYEEILAHPENHHQFKWILGNGDTPS